MNRSDNMITISVVVLTILLLSVCWSHHVYCAFTLTYPSSVVILEECRKNRRKSHMSASLLYFMEGSCKATDSDTLKVK